MRLIMPCCLAMSCIFATGTAAAQGAAPAPTHFPDAAAAVLVQ